METTIGGFKDPQGGNGKEDPTDRVQMAPQETLTAQDQEDFLQGFLITCQVRGSRTALQLRALGPTFKAQVPTFKAQGPTFRAKDPIFKALLAHGTMAHLDPTDPLAPTLANKDNLTPVGPLQTGPDISDPDSTIIRSLGFKTAPHLLTEALQDPILCLPTLICVVPGIPTLVKCHLMSRTMNARIIPIKRMRISIMS